jgi:hypothetical protein
VKAAVKFKSNFLENENTPPFGAFLTVQIRARLAPCADIHFRKLSQHEHRIEHTADFKPKTYLLGQ